MRPTANPEPFSVWTYSLLPPFALAVAEATRYADTAALFQALGGGWWHREDEAAASDEAKKN